MTGPLKVISSASGWFEMADNSVQANPKGAMAAGLFAGESLEAYPQNTNTNSKPSDLRITDMRTIVLRDMEGAVQVFPCFLPALFHLRFRRHYPLSAPPRAPREPGNGPPAPLRPSGPRPR